MTLTMIYIVATLVIVGAIYYSAKRKISSETINVIKEPKTDNSALLRKAENQFRADNFDTALISLDSLIEVQNFRTRESFELRAMVCENLGFVLDAIDDFDEALKLDNTIANNFFMRGLANQKIGNFTKTKADFEKAVLLSPQEELYQINLETIDVIHPAVKERIKRNAEANGLLKRRIKLA